MKRVIILLMASVMVLGAVSLASAVEFKASGHMMMLFGVQDNLWNTKYDKDASEDNFYAGLRFRPKLTIKGEGATAVFEAQSHQSYFGDTWTTNSPKIDFRVRNAYIDFKLPGTPVSLKTGFQQLALPSIWGHPVFHTRVGGALATVPVNDQIAVAAFWARPLDGLGTDSAHNSVDLFGVLAPMKFGGIGVTPYVVYGRVGGAVNKDNTHDQLIVGGANINANVSGFIVKVDAIITHFSSDTDATAALSAATGKDFAAVPRGDIGLGWMIALEAGYKMSFGTPALMAWYSPGADKDGEGMLWTVKSNDFTDGFSPTSLGYDGSSAWDIDHQWGYTGANTMGIGLKVSDMSFVDSLKHTFRVVYVMGTADDKLSKTRSTRDFWTEDDSMIEVNLDSTWNMYENLAAIVEIGAMKTDTERYEDDLGWRAQVNFNFKF